MSRRRKPMRQVRMILEYRFERHLSIERTGQVLSVAKGTVVNTLNPKFLS